MATDNIRFAYKKQLICHLKDKISLANCIISGTVATDKSVVKDAVFAAKCGDISYFCAYIVQLVAQGRAVRVVKRYTISSGRRQSVVIPHMSAGRTSRRTAQII